MDVKILLIKTVVYPIPGSSKEMKNSTRLKVDTNDVLNTFMHAAFCSFSFWSDATSIVYSSFSKICL